MRIVQPLIIAPGGLLTVEQKQIRVHLPQKLASHSPIGVASLSSLRELHGFDNPFRREHLRCMEPAASDGAWSICGIHHQCSNNKPVPGRIPTLETAHIPMVIRETGPLRIVQYRSCRVFLDNLGARLLATPRIPQIEGKPSVRTHVSPRRPKIGPLLLPEEIDAKTTHQCRELRRDVLQHLGPLL